MRELLLSLLASAAGTVPAVLDAEGIARLEAIPAGAWRPFINFAAEQNCVAVALDGLVRLTDANPTMHLSLEKKDSLLWYSYAAKVKSHYDNVLRTTARLNNLFTANGIRMMVMKGYSLSLDYPEPHSRYGGDIDIYLFGDTKKGNAIIEKQLGLDVILHEKHDYFEMDGIHVESHYDFLNSKRIKSLQGIESKLSKYAADAVADPDGFCYLPSSQFNAIYIPLHMAMHFVFRGAKISQLFDWTMFLLRHADRIDWDDVLTTADSVGCRRFIGALNRIAVRDFGVPADHLPQIQVEDSFADWVLDQILIPLPPPKQGTMLQKLRKYNLWRQRFPKVYGKGFWRYFFMIDQE